MTYHAPNGQTYATRGAWEYSGPVYACGAENCRQCAAKFGPLQTQAIERKRAVMAVLEKERV